ncbi:MAG TPA: J domain-containing protein [Planctomycetaceae bacterium]|nr:J domain-containing protein [Planctomycetaceae bacterium]
MAQDYYQLLGVSRSASQDEIQKAYRGLARKYHPDLNPDDKVAQQKFKDIQHAYDVIGEPEKREQYDRFGPDFERAGSSPFQGAGGPGFEGVFGGSGGFQMDDLGDLFRQFAGGGPGGGAGSGNPFGQGAGGAGRQRPPAGGKDLTAELTIPFATAVLGGQAEISVSKGDKQESITVKIPPGVDTGKKIRLRGQGQPAMRGGKDGDLIVELTVAPHPCFKRSGRNLEVKLPVSVAEAARGASVDLPTPGGTVTLKIPSGSSSGQRLRVKGQGIRSSNGEPGDLYVELQIRLPETLRGAELDEGVNDALDTLEQLYTEPLRGSIQW